LSQLVEAQNRLALGFGFGHGSLRRTGRRPIRVSVEHRRQSQLLAFARGGLADQEPSLRERSSTQLIHFDDIRFDDTRFDDTRIDDTRFDDTHFDDTCFHNTCIDDTCVYNAEFQFGTPPRLFSGTRVEVLAAGDRNFKENLKDRTSSTSH
jgi:hypothetical protein